MHFHFVPNIPLDIWRAAFFHQNCLEALTIFKRILIYFPQRSWKNNPLDPAVAKALIIEALDAIWEFYSFQIRAAIERLVLYLLQGGRKCDVLDRAKREGAPIKFF